MVMQRATFSYENEETDLSDEYFRDKDESMGCFFSGVDATVLNCHVFYSNIFTQV